MDNECINTKNVFRSKKMNKYKKLFKSWKMWVLVIFILFAVYEIAPRFDTNGVLVLNVADNSSAQQAGIFNPISDKYSDLEQIQEINDIEITTELDYYNQISKIQPDDVVKIKTDKDVYFLEAQPNYVIQNFTTITTEEIFQEFDNETNSTINITRNVTKDIPNKIINGTKDLGLIVMQTPSTNIKKGLDVSGGARLLVKPETNVDSDTMEMIRTNLDNRLNGLGLKDVDVAIVSDLLKNEYISITIAGKSNQDVLDLIQSQGKFEAKIGDIVVYSGDNNDITSVCRTGDCSYVEGCYNVDEAYVCRFRFSITLSDSAAARFGEVTNDLETVSMDENGNVLSASDQYLNKKLELLLDDSVIESLNIQASLKGNRYANQVSISGYGAGKTSQLARDDAIDEMLKLQTILSTGSIPVQLEVVNYEEVSSVLGDEFLMNALFVGLFAILTVTLIVSFRYKSFKVSLPMIITMLSELLILLGVAVYMNWQLDLVAIAGIIVAIGTGVDDQIIITDETLSKQEIVAVGWKEKIKRAFFIIFGAYLTTIVAMFPLLIAGAGLLKGFALTTMAGVTIGVLITRQAFAVMVEVFLKE